MHSEMVGEIEAVTFLQKERGWGGGHWGILALITPLPCKFGKMVENYKQTSHRRYYSPVVLNNKD